MTVTKIGNKNTVANNSNYSRKEKQACIANYDPPHCPALNRLKKRGKETKSSLLLLLQAKTIMTAGPMSQNQPNSYTNGDLGLCVSPPRLAAGLPVANFLVMFLLQTIAY